MHKTTKISTMHIWASITLSVVCTAHCPDFVSFLALEDEFNDPVKNLL